MSRWDFKNIFTCKIRCKGMQLIWDLLIGIIGSWLMASPLIETLGKYMRFSGEHRGES